MAKLLIILGLVILALGLIWQFAPWLLGWFGKLPGDIDIQKGNTRIFIPLGSMAVISLVLSIILNLFRH